jgi:hypothetical protein
MRGCRSLPKSKEDKPLVPEAEPEVEPEAEAEAEAVAEA